VHVGVQKSDGTVPRPQRSRATLQRSTSWPSHRRGPWRVATRWSPCGSYCSVSSNMPPR